ncbi:hypothetical protein CF15_02835 [Pyrodictium occultum]|uniref:SIS domain-containing protein n=1 Tax=Pyrodictium occultum TaxID=2309 RepID=A0A0V8RUN2_PYROC|nr:hypothetical protein [Pyrodictium occultum]KSW11760.1 hypothetical protein CF15_02835 [Pyrodictium occultum]
MLPIPRDSAALTQATLSRIEADSASKAKELVERLGTLRTIYVAFAGSFYAQASAHLLYWILRQLTDHNVYIDPIEAVIYHTLAYHEESPLIVLFAEPGTENIVARAADAARLTGARLVAVTPPLPGIIAKHVGRDSLVEVASQRPSLHYLLIAAKTAASLADKLSSIKVRVKRLIDEVSNISAIYESLIDAYKDTIESIRELIGRGELDVYASTTMLPAAYILAGYQKNTRIYPLSSLLVHLSTRALGPQILAMLTDVEEDVMREVRFKKSMYMNEEARVIELVMHTDPLTAPIYGSIIIEKVVDATRRG